MQQFFDKIEASEASLLKWAVIILAIMLLFNLSRPFWLEHYSLQIIH
jgi:hypothetical protein